MKTSIVRSVWAFTLILMALGGLTQAQVPRTDFKAGAYRGVVHLTTSMDGVGKTKASIKVKGRSTGNAVLQLIGTPQLAGDLLSVSDDSCFKVFRFEPELNFPFPMTFKEVSNIDADGTIRGRKLDFLTVGNNMVRAGLDYEETLTVTKIAFSIRIVLTRVGP
jgi:hypothetical protein